MKIVSWNANGKFREKYNDIATLDADVYVIQECENPDTCKDKAYSDFVKNGFWKGELNYKGSMVFAAKSDIKLERLDWGGDDMHDFIPVRVNDTFNLVAAWACKPYCEVLYDWVNVVSPHLNEEAVIIGDLNSNINLDATHRRSGKTFARVLDLIKEKGLYDMWTLLNQEEGGKESLPTHFMYRHLDKPYHLDHCLASPDLVKSMVIHSPDPWLELSDHMPIEITL